MNVDEATQAAKEYNENFVRRHFPLPAITYSQRVAITLLAEVERLRSELAAAKAASAVPVELVGLGDRDWEFSVAVKCKSSEDADTLYNWLRDADEQKGRGMSADNFIVIREFPEGWKWAMGFASSDDNEQMPDERFTSKAFDDVEKAYKDAEKDCGYVEYGIDIDWEDTTPPIT